MNDFQFISRLCANIKNGKFNWEKYLVQRSYFGRTIAVIPLHCSYGQIGFSVYVPFSNLPEIQYDWELKEILVGEVDYKEWLESKEGKQEVKRIEATERIKRESDRIRFLIDNNASAMTPLEMERSVTPYLSNAYAEQMMKSVSTPLQKHPYYLSFRNAVLARNIKVGNEVPDIAITLRDGKTIKLNDYRGKYILLDFWASTCEKSMKERTILKELYEMTKEEQEKFIIVSLSLDSDKIAWGNALDNNGLALDGWVQGNDTMGTESIATRLFGVKNTPHMILIDPEGRAISLNMEADEVQMRVEQILEGDLYYLDQSKE